MNMLCDIPKSASQASAPPASLLKAGIVIAMRPRQRLGLGRDGEHVYIVREGTLMLEALPQPSARQIIDLYYPGDAVRAQLLPSMSGLNLIASTPGEVVRLSEPRLYALADTDAAVRHWLDDALARQYPRRLVHLATVGSLSGEERVVSLLMELALRVGEATQNGARAFDMPLSRTDMADYLSLNADTLSRIMSRLRQSGVLSVANRGRGYAPNFEALCRLTPLADTIARMHATQ